MSGDYVRMEKTYLHMHLTISNLSKTYANGVQASFNLCMFAPVYYEELILVGDQGRLKAYDEEPLYPSKQPTNYLEVALGIEARRVVGSGGPGRLDPGVGPRRDETGRAHAGRRRLHRLPLQQPDRMDGPRLDRRSGRWRRADSLEHNNIPPLPYR